MNRFSALVLLLFTIAGCDNNSEIDIAPDHIAADELASKIRDKFPEAAEVIKENDGQIRISGTPDQLEELIEYAHQVDSPVTDYYLTISNTSPDTISTNSQQMRLRLEVGHKITLGYQVLASSPWIGLNKVNRQTTLQLMLDEKLRLSIFMADTRLNRENLYEGSHRLKKDKWTRVVSAVPARAGRKVISTSHNRPTEIWLLLTEDTPDQF